MLLFNQQVNISSDAGFFYHSLSEREYYISERNKEVFNRLRSYAFEFFKNLTCDNSIHFRNRVFNYGDSELVINYDLVEEYTKWLYNEHCEALRSNFNKFIHDTSCLWRKYISCN